jgi:hypothetical protein
MEPNDVDCVLLQGPTYHADSSEAAALRQSLPFLELKVAKQGDYDSFAQIVFGSDRDMIPKGIIEVEL